MCINHAQLMSISGVLSVAYIYIYICFILPQFNYATLGWDYYNIPVDHLLNLNDVRI